MMRIKLKHILNVILTICLLSIVRDYLESVITNPINKDDYSILFQSFGKLKKDKSEDLIKMSIHGEAFDIFRYKTNDVILGEGYPKFNRRWDDEDLTGQYAKSMWKETPIHAEDSSLVYPIVDANVVSVKSRLQKEIAELCSSDGNFYCYLQNGLNYCYLFVYSPRTDYLYYTRIKNLTL